MGLTASLLRLRERQRATQTAVSTGSETDVGLFGDLLGIAAPIVGSIFGGPAGGAAAGALAGAIAPRTTIVPVQQAGAFAAPSEVGIRTVSDIVAARAPGAVGGAARGAGFGATTGSVDAQIKLDASSAVGFGGGNGRFAKRTLIQTVDRVTGLFVSQTIQTGAPFLMGGDLRKIRSLTKKLLKASAKVPRRTARVSKQKQLTDAVVSEALQNVLTNGHCPG